MPLNYNNKIITIEKNSNCLMEFDLKLFETKFVQIRGAEEKNYLVLLMMKINYIYHFGVKKNL